MCVTSLLWLRLYSWYYTLARYTLTLGCGTTEILSLEDQKLLLQFYQTYLPNDNIIARSQIGEATDNINQTRPIFLNNEATFHKHIFIGGRRVDPSDLRSKASSSIIQLYVNEQWYVGEVTGILSHVQPQSNQLPLRSYLLRVHWFVKCDFVDTRAWDQQ